MLAAIPHGRACFATLRLTVTGIPGRSSGHGDGRYILKNPVVPSFRVGGTVGGCQGLDPYLLRRYDWIPRDMLYVGARTEVGCSPQERVVGAESGAVKWAERGMLLWDFQWFQWLFSSRVGHPRSSRITQDPT